MIKNRIKGNTGIKRRNHTPTMLSNDSMSEIFMTGQHSIRSLSSTDPSINIYFAKIPYQSTITTPTGLKKRIIINTIKYTNKTSDHNTYWTKKKIKNKK